jgi:tetratricopeptide (TPR) repeat protein
MLKANALYLTFLSQGPDAAVAKADSFLPAEKSVEPAGALMVIQAIAQAGRQKDAIVLAEKWQARAPSGELAATLASLYQRNGDSLKGLTLLESWIKSHNDDVDARFGLAQLYDALGKTDLAIAQYEWLVARKPDSSSVLNNLALLYDQKHDARARATAQNAVMLAPNSGPLADTLGWILIKQGDRAGGLKYLTQAGESTGGDPTVQYHLGVALYQNGNLNEARVVLNRVLRSNPPSEVGGQAKALLAKIGVPKK